ncbi:MAG: acyl-CoA/acyl-ACP dehydrogenase [Rhodopila sp.]|nr:acyl-CoA/acyl-ACP dehydrogenase [Rhodopila sp.]
MPATIDFGLAAWLDHAALALDTGTGDGNGAEAQSLLPRLAEAGIFRAGVPASLGGAGGDVTQAVEAIAAVSERSMAAGFVLWGQRTFIDYLLQSPNRALCERLLPDLLAGRVAGATGLSNAMKFLSGLEELQITAQRDGEGFRLDGKLPWVTNLRVQGFHVAAAVGQANGPNAFVASLSHDSAGLTRSRDLDLMAMRGTSTAAIRLEHVHIGPGDILHPHAATWLPQVRPAFLGMQCGMSIGLARRALAEAQAYAGPTRQVLCDPIAELTDTLAAQERALTDGLRAARFHAAPARLFELRIGLAETAAQAVSLELQASGGRAYLAPHGDGFARRWREAAFVPVVTPSLVQLKAALASQGECGQTTGQAA